MQGGNALLCLLFPLHRGWPTMCRCDVSTADPKPSLYRRVPTKGFSPDDFVTEQVRHDAPWEPPDCS